MLQCGMPVLRCLTISLWGHVELGAFVAEQSMLGIGVTIFEFVRLMHALAANLSQIRAIRRGGGSA
jgi:hypothetical protein